MPKQHVNPLSLFPSIEHGFSQVVVAGGAKTVFISGQTAWDVNKKIVGGSLGEQARQALRNVKAAVEAAGGTLSSGAIASLVSWPTALEIRLEHVGDKLQAVESSLCPVL